MNGKATDTAESEPSEDDMERLVDLYDGHRPDHPNPIPGLGQEMARRVFEDFLKAREGQSGG